MIEVKELRIGNCALFNGDWPGRITITSLEKIYENPNCVSPILLTPEILEKCGLLKDEHPSQNVWSNDFMIMFFNEEIGFYTGYWKTNFKIKYLHQLQNLYFALTNKELEITF